MQVLRQIYLVFMNTSTSERVIIVQVGIQLRLRNYFPGGLQQTNCQFPPNIHKHLSETASEPHKNSCLQTNQISRLYFQVTSNFFSSKYVACPTYNIFLKLLSKYFQFKFRKFCLSFINKFQNFQMGNTHHISSQLLLCLNTTRITSCWQLTLYQERFQLFFSGHFSTILIMDYLVF